MKLTTKKKPSPKKRNKQERQIREAQAAANAAQASANQANAAAAAQASTSVVQSTASASTASAMSTASSTASANLSTASASTATAMSTASSQAVVDQANTSALQSVIVGAGTNGVSIVGGLYSNTAFALGNAAGFSATLTGDTLGAAVLKNASNTPFTIDVSGVTESRSWYMTGGSTQDTYIFSSGAQLGQSVITAGGTNATDIISFNGAATVTDANLSGVANGVYNLQAFSGTAASTFTVGSVAEAAGVSSLTGGSGADVITVASTYGTSGININAKAGNDSITFATLAQLTNATVNGDSGTADTLSVNETGISVSNANFVNTTNTEAFVFGAGADSFTFGTRTATAGIASVFGGAGADTFTFATGLGSGGAKFYGGDGANVFTVQSGVTTASTFVGGNDGNTFNVATSTQLGESTFTGGDSNDVLNITSATTLANANFTSSSSIETLNLTGASDLSYGTQAQAAGIVTINTGSGNTTFSDAASLTLAYTVTAGAGSDSFTINSTNGANLIGGAGNDTFSFGSTASFTSATINGGSDSNQISFVGGATGGVSLADSAFANISAGTIQVLNGGTMGGNSFVVGSNALAAGITQVVGGTGSDFISALSYGTNTVSLSGNSGADLLVGASSGASTFLFQDQYNFAASSITGGSTLLDTVGFNESTSLVDGDFANISKVESVKFFNNSATSSVTFGPIGASNGITSLSAVGSGAVTFSLLSSTYAASFTGGAGTDSFVIGAGASNAYTLATISGGAGRDTLAFQTGAGDAFTSTINDSVFTNITNVEVVTGSTTSTFNVGSTALGAGVVSVVQNGTGAATFNIGSDFGTTGISLSVSTGGTGTFNFVNGTGFANSTITGGSSTHDAVVLSAPGTFTSLANISGIEVISLTGGSSLSFTNGPTMIGTNSLAIYTGTGASVVNATGQGANLNLGLFGTSAYSDTFTGGAGNDILNGWSGTGGSTMVDYLTGGAGNDTFVVTNTTPELGYASGGYAFITDFGNGSDKIQVGSAANTASYQILSSTGTISGFSYNYILKSDTSVPLAYVNSSVAFTNANMLIA